MGDKNVYKLMLYGSVMATVGNSSKQMGTDYKPALNEKFNY